ncbi:serine hydrolase domain-containing protein [Luteococcus sanguinis]|uniref:Serine hydrolase domain-containing protein n=1 Tax=Luteococcus sanguinis TaxID=174038 RepID=A0ABW1WZ53_9ACTN
MPLTRTDALTAGIDPRALLDFIDAQEAAGQQTHALLVLRRGELLAEGYWAPFAPADRQLVYSLSKTFTSAAVGICVADGLFGYDDLIVDLLPELATTASERARTIRVRDCLAMATGHEHDMADDFDRRGICPAWLADSFAAPVTGTPGETFCYNQVAPYALSLVVSRHAGRDLLQVLDERVLTHLGAPPLVWQRDTGGQPIGFSGLVVDATTAARFFALIAADGRLQGEQLLPSEWIERHRVAQVQTAPGATGLPADGRDWERGYGWLVWMGSHGYRGDGAFGQYGVVLPEHDLVVCMFGEVADMQVPLDNLWRHLLPGIDRPGTAAAQAELDQRLAHLATPTVDGEPIPADAFRHGWCGDQAFQLGSSERGPMLGLCEVIEQEQSPWQEVPIGHGRWLRSQLEWPELGLVAHVAVSGALVEGIPVVHLRSLDTPHTLVFTFGSDPEQGMRWRLEPLGGAPTIRQIAVPALPHSQRVGRP